MKNLFAIVITAIAGVAFATSTFAGDCGSCPVSGDKKKDKTEEATQS